MRKIYLLLTLALLASCSTNTVEQLQSEFDNHRYSRYVSDNLKVLPLKAAEKSSSSKKTLNVLKSQIGSRKNKAAGQINGAVYQNGIFKSSRVTQQQIVSLNTKEQSESWLSNHSGLNDVLSMALENNQDIQSAKEQAIASLAKYDQVGFLDDMLAQYAAFTQDINLTGSTQKHQISVSKSFPFPGLLTLKSSIIDQAVESSRLALKQTVQDVITNTRVVYYQLQFSQQEIAITKQNTKLLLSLKEELKSSYSTNSSDLSGILKVDIEVANNRNKLQVAKDEQQAKQARLNALLNISSGFVLGNLDKLKAENLERNAPRLKASGKINRVELASLRTEAEKMKRIIQLSEKRFYPDFDAGFSRFQNGKFTTKAKIKKSNFFAKNDAYLTEIRAKYKALQSKIRALENNTAEAIQQAVSNHQSKKSTYALYRNKVIPKAKTTLDIAKNLYETGEASYTKVIDAQKMILNYRLKLQMALRGINVTKAKLDRLVGGS